jgi:hypothetical protein
MTNVNKKRYKIVVIPLYTNLAWTVIFFSLLDSVVITTIVPNEHLVYCYVSICTTKR